MKFLLLVLALLQVSFLQRALAADSYCFSMRGGDFDFFWQLSAATRIIEDNGMPSSMAGGGSAAVAMMFIESVGENPAIQAEKNLEKKILAQAFLLKSIPTFFSIAEGRKPGETGILFVEDIRLDYSSLNIALKELSKKPYSSEEFLKAIGVYSNYVRPEILAGLAKTPDFYRAEIQNLGLNINTNNIVSDKNLFFHQSFFDQKSFALNLSKAADFYAGNTEPALAQKLIKIAGDCGPLFQHLPWPEVEFPNCKEKFREVVLEYLNKGNFQNKRILQEIGGSIGAIVSTAVINGASMEAYKVLGAQYEAGNSSPAHSAFSVNFDKDFHFGYFGNKKIMELVGQGISKDPKNLKSAKFKDLGTANWLQAISATLVNPKVSNFQKLIGDNLGNDILSNLGRAPGNRWIDLKYRTDFLSLGGWADSNPAEVLKASGCKNIVYLTRLGAEDVKLQQLFIRLTNGSKLLPFWTRIAERNEIGWPTKDSPSAGTPWDRLYNYFPKTSSFNRSLELSDAVSCPDFNGFSPEEWGQEKLIKEAYSASVLMKPGALPGFKVVARTKELNDVQYRGCMMKQ